MAFFKNAATEWEKTMTENDLDQMEAQGLDVSKYREKLAARRAKEAEEAKRDRELYKNPTQLDKLKPYMQTPRSSETEFFRKLAGKAPWLGKSKWLRKFTEGYIVYAGIVSAPAEAWKGVKFVPSAIQMTLPVDIYTEKTVEVPLHGINFPADKVLRAFPSKVQVTFQVGVSRFRQITAEDFHINVSYEELLDLGASKYTVKLRSIPEGVSHVRFYPEQVDFLIEQVSPGYGD